MALDMGPPDSVKTEVDHQRSGPVPACQELPEPRPQPPRLEETLSCSILFQFLAAGLITCLASASIGTVLGFSAILLPQLESDGTLSSKSSEASWIASLSNIGQLLGALLTGWVSNQFGRKRAIMVLCLPLALGWSMVGLSGGRFEWICVGRVLQGIGIMSSVTQVYLIEIADVANRSQFGASGALSVSAGITLVYILGATWHWTWVCAICGTMAVLTFLSMLVLPETPNWLSLQGRGSEAQEAFKWLHGSHLEPASELEFLQPNRTFDGTEDTELPRPTSAWSKFREPEGHRPFLILLCIFFLQQSTGSFAVIFYAVSIFQDIGVASDPYLAAIFTGCIRLVGTLVGTVLAKHYSGKWLMVTSALLMALAMFLLGWNVLCIEALDGRIHFSPGLAAVAAIDLQADGTSNNNGTMAETDTAKHETDEGQLEEEISSMEQLLRLLPVVEIVFYMLAFGIGVGTVPWLLLGELCPPSIKGLTSGFTMFVAFGTIFAVVKLYPELVLSLGKPCTYWVFGVICILTALFTPPPPKMAKCVSLLVFGALIVSARAQADATEDGDLSATNTVELAELIEAAPRRTLSRFTIGHQDNTMCWDRPGKDGFFSVVDAHNHFRPFGGPAVPLDMYINWMRTHGIVFTTVFGIGQKIVKRNPNDPDCCYYLHCPTFNYTVEPDPVNDIENAKDVVNYMAKADREMHMTLSYTSPNLQKPEKIISIMDSLEQDYPDVFQWAGEINVFKHALAGNGFFNQPRVTETFVHSGALDPFFQKMEEKQWPVTLHCDLGCDNYDSIPLVPPNPLRGCEVPEKATKAAMQAVDWWKEFMGPHYSAFFEETSGRPKRNFRKIQHLKVWDAILSRFPQAKIVWAHMGLSKELKRLHPIVHIHVLKTLFDRHSNLFTDLSWDVLAKQLLMNYNNEPIDRLSHFSHEDFEADAASFLFNHTHVNEIRSKLQDLFDTKREVVEATGSGNVILGPTHAMALYLDLFQTYNDRFITGTDFVASYASPQEFPGLRAFKSPASGCMKDQLSHARQLTDTSSVNMFLNNESFRKIVLGENYFKLIGQADTFSPPPICGDESGDGDGLSTGHLIAIIIIALLLICLVLAVAAFIYKKIRS
eukprot:maker-scaffold455_size166772-snap-gene-0.29 protein:Tk12514 transcript:maker-scaffold455_size166772-snap-gene-0.29-mRNA-1 annotation:"hypothetical protein BRAFLDRAFT_82927"